MIRRIFLVCLFLLSGTHFAQDRISNADLSALPKEKQLEIQQQIEEP